MEKRERIPKYVDIKETRCGKCKHLKHRLGIDYVCEAHGETLPDIVVDFFGEACKDFEEL